MKTSVSARLHRAQFPLLLACVAYVWAYIVGVDMGLAYPYTAQTAIYLLLAEICLLLPGRVRLIGGCAGAALMIGCSAAMLPVKENLAVMVIPVGLAALLLASLPIAAWPPDKDIKPLWPAIGLLSYILPIEAIIRDDHYQPPFVLPLWAGFVILLALSLMSMSRSTIRMAAAGRAQAPARVRHSNMLMTLGYLALALVLAMLPGIARAIRSLWRMLVNAVTRLVAWLTALLPTFSGETGDGGGGMPESFAAAEQAAPSAFQVFLERLMAAVAFMVLAALAVLALRILYCRLKALWKRLVEGLGRFAASASEDYVDEVTDTREGAAEGPILPRFMRQRVSARGEKQMPPRERVRHRYLRLRRTHPEWRPGWTARETIPSEPAAIYERARYSDREIGEEDAQRFMEGVKHI